MNGFLIIDKPKEVTSHDVVAFARRRLKIKKIGHTGTLDPMATGVLVLGVGVGTRLIEYLVGCDKEYEAEITFGATSDTDDAEGEIISTSNVKPFRREDLEDVLLKFMGEIMQTPPKYSAIKLKGKPAYARMRAGEEVKMSPRKIKIFDIRILKFNYPQAIIKVHCGSGTYIRSLARDLGDELKTGAHLSKLRRTRAGDFGLDQAVTLKSICAEKLLSLETGILFPRLNLTRVEAEKIRVGQKIACRAGEDCDQFLAGFFEDKLLAILEHEKIKRTLKPVKVFV